jgi:hypothetical protein
MTLDSTLAARTAAQRDLSRAQAARRRHPGPLGQQAVAAALAAFTAAHQAHMRAFDDAYFATWRNR